MSDAREIEIGIVGKPHGVRGGIHLFLHNPSSELIDGLEEVTVASPDGRTRKVWTISRLDRPKKNLRVAGFAELTDRDAAEAHRGWKVLAPATLLPTLDDDEFYYHELPGWPVVTPAGRTVGTVERVVETNLDILVVKRTDGGELLVPVVSDYVLDLDRATKRVIVVEELEEYYEDVL